MNLIEIFFKMYLICQWIKFCLYKYVCNSFFLFAHGEEDPENENMIEE